jgi:hypothetical protein
MQPTLASEAAVATRPTKAAKLKTIRCDEEKSRPDTWLRDAHKTLRGESSPSVPPTPVDVEPHAAASTTRGDVAEQLAAEKPKGTSGDVATGTATDATTYPEATTEGSKEGEAVPATLAPMPTWSPEIEAVNPDSLCDHALWAEIAGPETPEREEELVDDVRDGEVGPEIVMVTGERCAGGPGTILRGTRYVHAVTAARGRTVLVVRRTDLDASAQEIILIRAALAGRHARRMKPSRVAALHERLYAIYSRPSGFRSDLATSVGTNGGPIVAGDTLDHVAKATKQPRNFVANIRKVFVSPISALALHEAVDAESLSLTAAAQILRDVEGQPEVGAVLRQAEDEKWTGEALAQNAVVHAARTRVEERVREQTGKRPTPTGKISAKSGKEERTITVEAPGKLDGDNIVLDCIFRSRRTRVTVIGRVVRLEDLGRDGNGRNGAK